MGCWVIREAKDKRIMLQGINRIGRSWVGKIVVAVLFGFLIISFAIWGIGDIFRGAVRTDVAKVGGTAVSAEAYRNAYQGEIQRLARQTRQSITLERARALGIDAQVLGRLITEATLDQKARSLGLGVSDQLVVRTISEDPNFQNANGQFDRARFEEVLFSNQLNEAGYVREQRATIARLQLAEAISGALPVPLALREAIHRFSNERRSAAYLTLPASTAGEIAAPTEDQLKSFYEERKNAFRAPEYRTIHVVSVTPETLAKPESVSDDDARQRYEQLKGSRFGTPEKRTIQQILFPTMEQAEAASKRLKEGASFEALASENNVDAKSLELGTFARSEMFDAAVADAAFALQEGAASEPIQGRFGNVIVRVTKVQPESVRPFEEVADEVKRDLATERSRNEIDTLHDAVEDMRASARPLAEIAKEKGLPLVTLTSIDRTGRDKSGAPVQDVPERDALLNAAFNSDVGADNEALRTRNGGYVWFDVTGVEPARDKPLDEIRDSVAAQWRSDQIARQLADKARAIVERLDKGEPLEAIAGELGLKAETASDLARSTSRDNLPVDVVNRIFSVPVGKAASAAPNDETRVVFKVTGATLPPFVTSTSEAGRIEDQLRIMLGDDLLTQYIAQLQKDIGVSISEPNMRRALGGGES
jgi:peptidyl-prolyl cis-trans isomerase D